MAPGLYEQNWILNKTMEHLNKTSLHYLALTNNLIRFGSSPNKPLTSPSKCSKLKFIPLMWMFLPRAPFFLFLLPGSLFSQLGSIICHVIQWLLYWKYDVFSTKIKKNFRKTFSLQICLKKENKQSHCREWQTQIHAGFIIVY